MIKNYFKTGLCLPGHDRLVGRCTGRFNCGIAHYDHGDLPGCKAAVVYPTKKPVGRMTVRFIE